MLGPLALIRRRGENARILSVAELPWNALCRGVALLHVAQVGAGRAGRQEAMAHTFRVVHTDEIVVAIGVGFTSRATVSPPKRRRAALRRVSKLLVIRGNVTRKEKCPQEESALHGTRVD